jgi:hypothetical protein
LGWHAGYPTRATNGRQPAASGYRPGDPLVGAVSETITRAAIAYVGTRMIAVTGPRVPTRIAA